MHDSPSLLWSAWQRLKLQLSTAMDRPVTGKSGITFHSDSIQSPLLSKYEIAFLRKQALKFADAQHRQKSVLDRHHGENLSPRNGAGIDYEESRTYQPGDEIRFINWRITARTNEPHVKIFHEERLPSAFIVLDRRPSMRFGTRSRLKVTQALRLAVLHAFYLHYSGWQISGAIMEDTLHWLDVASDEPGLLALIDIMNKPCPPQAEKSEYISLAQAFRHLLSTLNPGTRLLVCSDFIDINPDTRVLLSGLTERHDVSAFHIIDPAEIQLPRAGQLQLSSNRIIGSNDTLNTIDTSDYSINKLYAELIGQHLLQCEALLRNCGARYSKVMTTAEGIEEGYLEG